MTMDLKGLGGLFELSTICWLLKRGGKWLLKISRALGLEIFKSCTLEMAAPAAAPPGIQHSLNAPGAAAPETGVLGAAVNAAHPPAAWNLTWPSPSNILHAVARVQHDGLVLDAGLQAVMNTLQVGNGVSDTADMYCIIQLHFNLQYDSGTKGSLRLEEVADL